MILANGLKMHRDSLYRKSNMMMHLLNIRMQAINKSIQNKLSNGMTSVPLKYRPNGIGQQSVKLIKPIIVNENAIIGTGGSPITFRNIT